MKRNVLFWVSGAGMFALGAGGIFTLEGLDVMLLDSSHVDKFMPWVFFPAVWLMIIGLLVVILAASRS